MRSKTALVSIGIPFYNSEQYLDFAIRSVFNQTYANWELFLLDDGSTDESLIIAKRYKNDSRVSVISDGENKGLPFRLNQLSDFANGKYYARMDADDIMFPERIEIQLKCLESNSEIDVLGSSAISIDHLNNIVGRRSSSNKKICKRKEIINNGCFLHPSVMGKSRWFEKNKYNVKYLRAQDLELWVRTVENSSFHVCEQPLLFYREVGVPTFKKYSQSMAMVFNIYNQYISNKNISFYIRLGLKLIVYYVFSVFQKTDFLIRMRSKELKNPTFYLSILQKSIL